MIDLDIILSRNLVNPQDKQLIRTCVATGVTIPQDVFYRNMFIPADMFALKDAARTQQVPAYLLYKLIKKVEKYQDRKAAKKTAQQNNTTNSTPSVSNNVPSAPSTSSASTVPTLMSAPSGSTSGPSAPSGSSGLLDTIGSLASSLLGENNSRRDNSRQPPDSTPYRNNIERAFDESEVNRATNIGLPEDDVFGNQQASQQEQQQQPQQQEPQQQIPDAPSTPGFFGKLFGENKESENSEQNTEKRPTSPFSPQEFVNGFKGLKSAKDRQMKPKEPSMFDRLSESMQQRHQALTGNVNPSNKTQQQAQTQQQQTPFVPVPVNNTEQLLVDSIRTQISQFEDTSLQPEDIKSLQNEFLPDELNKITANHDNMMYYILNGLSIAAMDGVKSINKSKLSSDISKAFTLVMNQLSSQSGGRRRKKHRHY
jgi:predicted RNA-binding protein YlxR (DUF448 family)